jgi:hypothetical protein
LELHCRQKPPGVQRGKRSNPVVAGLQQESYSQLINKNGGQRLGQLVGDLWSGCAAGLFIPHREFADLVMYLFAYGSGSFYPKMHLAPSKVSIHQHFIEPHEMVKFFSAPDFFDHVTLKSPKPVSGQGLWRLSDRLR